MDRDEITLPLGVMPCGPLFGVTPENRSVIPDTTMAAPSPYSGTSSASQWRELASNSRAEQDIPSQPPCSSILQQITMTTLIYIFIAITM